MARAFTFFAVVTAVSAAAGMGVSYYYWRYPIAPPPLLAKLSSIRTVEMISAVRELDPMSGKVVQIEPIDQQVLQNPTSWYLDPPWRLLLKLHNDGISLQAPKPIPAELANALWRAADQSTLLIEGMSGYPDTKTLYGNMGVGRLADGAQVAFAVVAGYEYSNDHYPYYEIVARLDAGRPTIISSQWYYFDVAGMEGLTWLPIAVLCFIVLAPIAGVLLLFGMHGKSRAQET